MPIEPTSLFQQAEDFLRRHLKSKAVRQAEKRRRQRRNEEAMRRLRLAAILGGTGGAGILGYGAAVAPLGSTALIAAVAAIALTSGAALLWPKRHGWGGDFSREELAALPVEAEEWLLLQREYLPGAAAGALDAILDRLADLQPRLGEIDPNSALAWEARRLIGDHLPNLVADYCALPSVTHQRDPQVRTLLINGLSTLADELAHLCEEVSRDQRMMLETRGRFIESRYRDRLSGR
jgi:hypothetical protein